MIWWLERRSEGASFGEYVSSEGRGVSTRGADGIGGNGGAGEGDAGGVEGDGGGFGSI